MPPSEKKLGLISQITVQKMGKPLHAIKVESTFLTALHTRKNTQRSEHKAESAFSQMPRNTTLALVSGKTPLIQ